MGQWGWWLPTAVKQKRRESAHAKGSATLTTPWISTAGTYSTICAHPVFDAAPLFPSIFNNMYLSRHETSYVRKFTTTMTLCHPSRSSSSCPPIVTNSTTHNHMPGTVNAASLEACFASKCPHTPFWMRFSHCGDGDAEEEESAAASVRLQQGRS